MIYWAVCDQTTVPSGSGVKWWPILADHWFRGMLDTPPCVQAQFNHTGTTEEYLYHMCSNGTLARAYGFTMETMVRHVERDSGQGELEMG